MNTKLKILTLIAALTFTSDLTAQLKVAPPAVKTGKDVYDKFDEPLRSELVKEWEEAMDVLEKAVKRDANAVINPGNRNLRERQKNTQVFNANRKKFFALKKNVPPYFAKGRKEGQAGKAVDVVPVKAPPALITYLELQDFKVGAKGNPDGGSGLGTDIKIIQVIDDSKMLVKVSDRRTGTSSITVMLKYPTQGLTDNTFYGIWGQVIGNDKAIHVTGTETYRTAAGGSRTVLLVEVVK